MENTEKWSVEKNKYIKILNKSNKILDDIKQLSQKGKIMTEKDAKKLQEIAEKNAIYLKKMEKDEFEIAIVGLEKSGKSSFANALITNDILPHASSRCTFTQTELQYGPDRAEIEFYTREEFELLFVEMMRNLNYDNAENLRFDVVRLEDFEAYFNQLMDKDAALYKEHVGKTEEDIKDILRGQAIIKKYLDSPIRIFEGQELQTKDFEGFITDPFKSRAVKKISIHSSKLSTMKNVIIYDVPGFDSPTKIHETQTLERLKKADGIILVTNAGTTPNLLGTQLRILLRESDHDGIKLNEKLFIYGNQIDRVNNEEDARNNIEVLTNDAVNRFKIVTKDRLFIGSALAYLQKKQVTEGNDSVLKMEQLNLSDRIEELRAQLEKYYKNERFEVLKKRVNKHVDEMKALFQVLMQEYSDEKYTNHFHILDSKLLLGLLRSSQESVQKELVELRDQLKDDIPKQKYFTHKLTEQIDNVFIGIDMEKIEEIRKKFSLTYTEEFPAETVNIQVRSELYSDFTEQFKDIVVNIADEKAKEINDKILSIFQQGLMLNDDNPYFVEMIRELEVFLNRLTLDVSYDKKSFIHLIERFSRDLFDILILYPFASEDRKNKFLRLEEEFYSLAMYDDNKQLHHPYHMQPFIRKILAHKEPLSLTREEIEDKLKEVLNKYPHISGALTKESEPVFQKFTADLFEARVDIEEFFQILSDKLSKVENNSTDVVENITIRVVERSINQYLDRGYLLDKDAYLQSLFGPLVRAVTKEEIVEEVNRDISCLVESLKGPVLKAISLEKPFLSTMIKQINILLDKTNSQEFDDFLSDHATKIKYHEFAEHEKQKSLYENGKVLLEKIRNVVQEMEL